MTIEGQLLDKKSLRAVSGKTADWSELAKDCIAFANATGGRLLIGIEDEDEVPPSGQVVPASIADTIRKKIGEKTVGVVVLPQILTAENGGQYLELTVVRSIGVASTTDGKYYLRIIDQSKPVTGDDVLRLANERSTLPWETQTTLAILRESADPEKLDKLIADLRTSDRVKSSVKEKTQDELLDHYQLAEGSNLTNLGVLCVGRQRDRAKLSTAPVVQFIKQGNSQAPPR